MADISTGRQRGIVPFVDETTGRLPDQYLPQGVIDLQGNLEQAVTDASQSTTAAKASETSAKASADSAASSKDAAAQSASAAQESAQAAETSKTNAAASASAAETSKTNAASSASAAKVSETNAADSATAAQQAVDGFGLEVGTTTTGEPGSDAAVSIAKQGAKYVADFTIPQGPEGPKGPKGDPGDLTTVAHDDTLTGNGTSASLLSIADGNAFSKPIRTVINLNDARMPGLYDLTAGSSNGPHSGIGNRGGVIVVRNAGSAMIGQIAVQNYKSSWGVAPGLYFRSSQDSGDNWSDWDRLAFISEVNALTSHIVTLETQLQALQTRANSLNIN